jgi:surface protein
MGAESFDQNLSGWKIGQVTNLNSVFTSTERFDGDVSTWDVSNVTDFGNMFSSSIRFNQDLSSWDTSRAKYMYGMFNYASSFQGGGLSNWDTAQVTDMKYMFRDAKMFAGDISRWDVGNVNTTAYMVRNFMKMLVYVCAYYPFRINPTRLNILTYKFVIFVCFIRTIKKNYQLYGATSFNANVSVWNVSQILDATFMFHGASSFHQNLCTWNDVLPSNVVLNGILTNSGCSNTITPMIQNHSTTTPFCMAC